MNIANARNTGEHGSAAQKSIWHSMMMLAPFEGVAIDNDSFDKECIEYSRKVTGKPAKC